MTIAKKPAAVKKPARTVSAASAAKPTQRVIKPASKLAVVAPPIVPRPAKPVADKPAKAKKPKLVRDSFTIPKAEYLVLDELKQRAGKMSSPAKKSELLRAGIKALAAMPDAALQAALQAVPAIKTGRPSKA